uniref:K Homology domain-containing protein n=1 Tax=Panagrolaimus sp. PS1159 TaxID=55785 RepID=A0AC35F3S6_9BILA
MSSGAVANNHAVVQEAVARAQQLAATNTSSSSDRLTAGQKRPSSTDNSFVPAKRSNDGQSSAMNMNEQVLVEIIEIPDNVVGLVIGRGGDQITTIQQQSGCRVQMAGEPTPQNTRLCTLNGARANIELCTLNGARANIDRARSMISEVITKTNMKNNGQMPQQQQSSGNGGQTPPTQ